MTISYSFWMGQYEVTQGEYLALMGNNPSTYPGATMPMESLTWQQARAYCAALTAQQTGLGAVPPGHEYRLPTETEWEYACRAGTMSEFHFGPTLGCHQALIAHDQHTNTPCAFAGTGIVGRYVANAFGLFDMHGNVFELCLDRHDDYTAGAVTDPFVPGAGSPLARPVIRGGGWTMASSSARSAYRSSIIHGGAGPSIGFRVVLAPILVP